MNTSSENGHNLSNTLQIVHDDSFMTIVSFLNMYEIFGSLNRVDRSNYSKINRRRNSICYQKGIHLLKVYNRLDSRVSLDPNQEWYEYIRHITPWPSSFDYNSLPRYDEVKEITLTNSTGVHRCIVYQGMRQGGNRSIASDNHFPAISRPFLSDEQESGLIIRSSVPFVKPFISDTFTAKIVYSLVAYYEISIFDAIHPTTQSHGGFEYDASLSMPLPCVCIGLCLAGYNVGIHMPGWRANSFGYHGDDGKLFHGSSVHSLGVPIAISSTFGAGDTVGCGLFYPPLGKYGRGGIFYTKNGQIVSEYSFTCEGVLANAWYPVVGTDCYNPIEINCGQRPFVFDIMAFEDRHIMKSIPELSIDNFHMTGDGLSVASLRGRPRNLLHPAVLDPWKHVRINRMFNNQNDPNINISSSVYTLDELLIQSKLSFFNRFLLRDTREYNRHNPNYMESNHDIYDDMFVFGDDEDDDFDVEDFVSEDEESYIDSEFFESDEDDDDVANFLEEYTGVAEFIGEDAIVENGGFNEMSCPCDGIGDKYDEPDNLSDGFNEQHGEDEESSSMSFLNTLGGIGSTVRSRSSSIISSADPAQAISAVINGLQKGIREIKATISSHLEDDM